MGGTYIPQRVSKRLRAIQGWTLPAAGHRRIMQGLKLAEVAKELGRSEPQSPAAFELNKLHQN